MPSAAKVRSPPEAAMRLCSTAGKPIKVGHQVFTAQNRRLLLPASNLEEVTQAHRREERGQPFAERHPRVTDTIEDDWIKDIERLKEEMKSFTKPESPADLFSLRCGDLMSVDGDDRGWRPGHRWLPDGTSRSG